MDIDIGNDGSTQDPLPVTVDSVLRGVADPLGAPLYNVLPQNLPWRVMGNPEDNNCPSPRIGSLCGKDAVGAAIGIALGGAAVLALAVAALASLFRASSRVVVLDDMAWAEKYAHIMPANAITSPYATQYAPGAGAPLSPGAGAYAA
eukprot:366450-Chlamydomonas_euryale.AAC.42